ncbi:MAG: hypothetical protein NT163_13140, partial [Chlorobiales bacterium]|nr:hypothetical protein [Chlorobiales bacterium]
PPSQPPTFDEEYLGRFPPSGQRRTFAEESIGRFPYTAPRLPPPSPPAECPICFNEFAESEMHTGPCTHKVCNDCYARLRSDSRYHVGGPNANKAICPICRFGPDTDPTGQQRGFGKPKKCRKCGGVKHC